MITGRHLLAAFHHRRDVLNKEYRQRILWPQHSRFPLQHLPRWRAAAAVGDIADIDTATAHGNDFCCEIVALQNDVTYAAARCDKVGKAGIPRARFAGGRVLRWITNRQQLDVIFVVKRDGVVRALARVLAARMHIKAHPDVLRDTLREVRHANHDMINAGKHNGSRRLSAPRA